MVQATGKLKAVTTVKTPLTLATDATFEDYMTAVVEPDQVTEVLVSLSMNTCGLHRTR